jgi:hypothetical protein
VCESTNKCLLEGDVAFIERSSWSEKKRIWRERLQGGFLRMKSRFCSFCWIWYRVV